MSRPIATTIAASCALGVIDFREALDAPLGLFDPDEIREAFDGDLHQLRDLLQSAIKKALELTGDEDWWPHVHALFDDFIVVEQKDGKLLRYGYAVNGTDARLDPPVEVQKTFEPVGNASGAMIEAAGDGQIFIEAGDASYRIRVIQAGISGNRNFYSDQVLREAVPLFENVRVLVKSDAEHLTGQGKDVRNLIGAITDASFVEGANPDTGEIQATLKLIEPDGPLAVKLREAWNRGLSNLFGFSIDASAVAAKVTRAGVTVREAKKFTKVRSVDLIVEPGAGGAVIDLVEAQQENQVMDRDQLIALLEAKGLLKGKNVANMSDDQLSQLFTEAWNGDVEEDDDPEPKTTTGDGDGNVDVTEAIRMVEARADMSVKVNASTLPQKAKDKLIERFKGLDTFTEAQVGQAIKDEADYLADFTESGTVRGLGNGPVVTMGETQFEKVEQMFEAFFDPEHDDHRHARSFKECYQLVTGDIRVTGQTRNCDEARFSEALNSASFGEVLGDSITRRMLADYNVQSQYDVWREFANIVSITDFRTQERTRWGGYGDLPVVAESGDYTALGSPTDEKASYAAAKRGGTEKITLEMIKNDDVGAIRQIPIKLSRSAKRTLGKFVLDTMVTNPVIYDGVTLFHATHGNLGTAALSAASVAAGRLAMKEQTEQDSGEKLSIPPKYLWVPDTLEEDAVDLFRRNTENDKTFVQSLSLQIMPVWYWTDANDWVMTADKNDIPSFELGFMDGQEEPELLVQDSPTTGSMFTNDETTYKMRHIYGGVATDYRGTYKGAVA